MANLGKKYEEAVQDWVMCNIDGAVEGCDELLEMLYDEEGGYGKWAKDKHIEVTERIKEMIEEFINKIEEELGAN